MIDYRLLISSIARKHGLDPAIVYGVCMAESSLDSGATRYEPHYRWLVRDTRLKPAICTIETEQAMQRTSWGLMQVMGAVLREQGLDGWINAICCDQYMQVEYGCRFLKKKIQRWGLEDGIAAYNSGTPRRGADGALVNWYYVERVMGHARRF